MKTRTWLAALACILLLGPLGCGGPGPAPKGPPNGKGSPNGKGPPVAALVKHKPEISMSAVDFAREYAEDEAAADKKYKGKLVEIDGVLDGMAMRNIVGDSFCFFEGHTPKGKVVRTSAQCIFQPALQDKVDLLSKGQKVKAVGKVHGGSLNVVLLDCDLVEAGPDPAVKVGAEQLAKEFSTDAAAADKKYAGKAVIVDGLILDLHVDGAEPGFAILAGSKEGKAVNVHALFPLIQRGRNEQFAKFKKGDKVTVKAECRTGQDISEGKIVLLDSRPVP